MIKSGIILAVVLTVASLSAHATGGVNIGNDNRHHNDYSTTDNSVTNKSKSSSKSSSSSRSSASAGASSTGVGIGTGGKAISGGNSQSIGGTSVSISGDKVDAAPAQAGSVVNNVAYECGGTAGLYASAPGFSAGGGSAFAFELCEDVYVARVAIMYNIPGAETFLQGILDRRMNEFYARKGEPTFVATPMVRD